MSVSILDKIVDQHGRITQTLCCGIHVTSVAHVSQSSQTRTLYKGYVNGLNNASYRNQQSELNYYDLNNEHFIPHYHTLAESFSL